MVEYRDGDLFRANGELDIIAHQVNCQGEMRHGVAKRVRYLYRNVYREYKEMCLAYNKSDKLLGHVQVIDAEGYGTSRSMLVANLFAQFIESQEGVQTTDYSALKQSLLLLRIYCEELSFAVDGMWKIGIPYNIGCGYGGGDWETVKDIIHSVFEKSQIVKLIVFKFDVEDGK